MVGQVTHKNCREKLTNKKDIALHLKRKSVKLTPKKKNSLRSKETSSMIWSNICFEEDESKNYKVVEKMKKKYSDKAQIPRISTLSLS